MENIGKYRVLKELGRGAAGRVYLADDPFSNRRVAVKVAFPEALKSSDEAELYRKMFLNEASLAGKLVHPHIVQIYDAVVEAKLSYIVMEYVEGGTLEKFCLPENLLDAAEVTEIIFKCVRALAFASAQGLTHRDIKPGNILIAGGTDIKIADFGASINKVSDRTIVSQVGSPAFMAPELITGAAQASEKTDIYALGMTMYYMLAGRLPFTATNAMSMAYEVVNMEFDPPSKHRGGAGRDLDAIVMKAVAKDPKQRFANWDEFGIALAQKAIAGEARMEEGRERADSERLTVLKTLPFFKSFPENEMWEVLRISKWRKLPPGTALISEGDIGDSFFILAGGLVKVTRGGKTLNALTSGDCLGEMSYLVQKTGPRSATVTTTSDCLVMKIRAQDLRHASHSCRQLFDQQFLRVLVERLERANQQLSVAS
jgi:eukaryotic-like serine/threonine-protein kinase